MRGATEGAVVDGTDDGTSVVVSCCGDDDGTKLGLCVDGVAVDGEVDGGSDGDREGRDDGRNDGRSEGRWEGISDGMDDGSIE